MIRIKSFLCDTWVEGDGPARSLLNPSTEEAVAEVRSGALDFAGALAHARSVGGPALRAMSFVERGALLKQMADLLNQHRDELLDLSTANNGTTRGDGKFDVDGAIFTLATYGRLADTLGNGRLFVEGEGERVGSGARYVGLHVRAPRPGVAVHINAFNFPAWGTFEKLAPALLAGMPVVTKPATATALVAFRMVELVVNAGILPRGTLSFVGGSPGDLLDQLGGMDCLAFTGSADTAAMIRSGKAFTHRSARVNIEADSLNAAVLAPDAGPGTNGWDTFLTAVSRDITQKTGQKCTAVRRVIVPEERLDEVREALIDRLSKVVVGNPAEKGVTMGPVATAEQLRSVRAGIEALSAEARVLCGGGGAVQGQGAPDGKGFFVAPTLLEAQPGARLVHNLEVFGPCATLIPYSGDAGEAACLIAAGEGSLVSAVYGDDRDWLSTFVGGAAAYNGRLVIGSEKVADPQGMQPGMVLPNLIHGGPGRAGGGEELGGARGLDFYLQRSALQGDSALLKKLVGA